jgi:hypothetical protein
MAKIPKQVSAYFSRLGKKNGAAGGKAAAANMTKAERIARAKKARAQREENRKEPNA